MLLLILIWLINEGPTKNCHGELSSILKYFDDYDDGDDA